MFQTKYFLIICPSGGGNGKWYKMIQGESKWKFWWFGRRMFKTLSYCEMVLNFIETMRLNYWVVKMRSAHLMEKKKTQHILRSFINLHDSRFRYLQIKDSRQEHKRNTTKKKKSPNSTNFKPKVIRCIEKNTQEPKAILLVTFLEMVSLRDLWKVVKVTSNDQEEKKIHGYSSRGGFVDHALSPKISGT